MTAKTKKPVVTAGKPATAKAVAEPNAPAQAPAAREQLLVHGGAEEAQELRVAKLALGSIAPNTLTAKTYAKDLFGPVAMTDAFNALSSSVKAVHAGDLCQAEAMLFSQASALNAIFNQLALRSHGQQRLQHLEAYLRLALKAQNQCRMTLETLATIKNPPVVFARQANFASGPQQVNNAAAPTPATPAAKIESTQTGLLEAGHVERLDTRAQGAAGGADPHMETVGTLDRPSHR